MNRVLAAEPPQRQRTWPPSSPSTELSQPPSRKSSVRKSKQQSPPVPVNTRDELLLSLMASEAAIDSRSFEILSAEQVDDLKKEHQLLSQRQEALSQKLSTETKIRDAALSLARINASNSAKQQQTAEQLDVANSRVSQTQSELYRVSTSLAQLHATLMEHRAAVLSFSVRSLEHKLSGATGADDSGYDSSNRSTLTSPATTFSVLSSPSSSKFEGAHFFAGHADAVVPRRKLSPEAAAAEIQALQTKLASAKEALEAAGKKQADMSRELSMIKLEKQEIETMFALEKEDQLSEINRFKREKDEWERQRTQLVKAEGDAEVLRQQLADIEAKSNGESAGLRAQLEEREQEIEEMRRAWEEERQMWEDEKMEDLARLQEEFDSRGDQPNEELEAGLASIQTIVKKHGVALYSRDNSLLGLLDSVSTHLDGVQTKLEEYSRKEAEWDTLRRKLEDDVRNGLDRREAMARELEDVRRERDVIRDQSSLRMSSVPESPSSSFADVERLLQPLWAVLPSPEARATKFGATRSYRTNSPTPGTPGGPNSNALSPAQISGVVTSLSDLDVRSLKSLYADNSRNNGFSTPSSSPHMSHPPQQLQPFNLEAFAQRVQALIADDRSLIERLIRFAQAHDLLKKNAERAQKLAQDSTHALETYQKQVRALEERNQNLGGRIVALQEEIQNLQDTVERLETEKRELENLAAEQGETCRQLSEANDTLSTRTLALAEEAAQASAIARTQLTAQANQHEKEIAALNAKLEEMKRELSLAQDEVEAMRTSEQSQRIALLDELNSMQTENGSLRAQLRAAKK
ncbi:hypothetical protein JR316_0004462 [Psilocybe cubensis]|uniref:Up-regulated during septation protein 1 domain-containing protein n=2 Tax=Psilocybe cubensis TaxID=181762 RepID=A0A8H8CJM9_PSICU|nr:hypothetical protein JR316_0004462 [Psilocybe cubensis]KAH9482362.1 hypothetical protein JR316_0004462 [Psilocybe cubensis]